MNTWKRRVMAFFLLTIMIVSSVSNVSYANPLENLIFQETEQQDGDAGESVIVSDESPANSELDEVADESVDMLFSDAEQDKLKASDEISENQTAPKEESLEDVQKGLEQTSEVMLNPPDMGENPDHLSFLDSEEIQVPVDENIYPETMLRFNPNMMRVFRSNRSNNPPIIGVDHPTTPGEVMLFKEAEKVDGLVNTFDVTLRMEAKDSAKKSDIVLVIDTSGSMRDNGRMPAAKNAANEFVNKLLPSSTTRIAVVKFASNVSTVQSLTNNASNLHSAINSLYPDGGTFTQAGIRQARAILNNSDADFKHIVLLSDGLPTFSYKIGNGHNANDYYTEEINPDINIPEGAFTSTRVGDGRHLNGYEYEGFFDKKEFNNGNNAIAESKYAKSDGYSLWTIALEAGDTGNQVLNAVASQNQAYEAEPDQLAAIFNEIGGKISSAMQNAHVTDPMGTGFQVTVGDVNIQAVPESPAPVYDTSQTPHKLIWEPGTLTTPIAPNSDIKYAELKYRVEINDDILGVTPDPNGQYDTNGNAQITYTDIDGHEQTTSFPNPVAKPIIVEMKKVLLDSEGNAIPASDDRSFNFNLKLADDVSFNQDYEVKGNKSRIMTDLRIDKVYNFVENEVNGTHPGTLGDYYTTSSWKTWDGSQELPAAEGTSLTGFTIPRDANRDPLNTTITVINKEKADGILKIKKEFDPSLPMVASLDRGDSPSYNITVVGKSLYSEEEIFRQTYPLKVGESKEITGLRYGRYFVTENGFKPDFNDDYEYDNDGIVELRIDNKEANVTVINKPNSNDVETNLLVKKTWTGGKPAVEDINFDIYDADDDVKIEEREFVALSNDEAVNNGLPEPADNETYYACFDLQKYNNQGLEIKYTIKEKDIPAGYISIVPKEPTEESYEVGDDYEIKFLQWNVINTPQKDITVTKHWDDANGLNRANVKLTLYRKVGDEALKPVAGADPFIPKVDRTENDESKTWSNLPLYDEGGNEYTYFVKEEFADSGDVNNQNWEITENNKVIFAADGGSVTVTNTPISGEDNLGKLKIEKKLVNETSATVDAARFMPRMFRSIPLKFTFKVTGPNGYSKTVELEAGEEITISNLYFGEYKVVETEAQGFTPSYEPVDGKVKLTNDEKEKTVTVTNTNNGGDTLNVKKTVSKVWAGGPKPETTIELWRKNNVVGADEIDEKVNEFTTTAGQDSTHEFTETSSGKLLAKYDGKGNEFEYYAKEPTAPANYDVKYSDDGLTVTNTYTQPETDSDVIATKTWENAENYNPKPVVQFELWRKNGTAGGGEKVEKAGFENPVVVPENGEVNFGKQFKTDINGVQYEYFVKEIFVNTVDEDNWIVSGEDGLNITNTLKSGEDVGASIKINKVLKNEQDREPSNGSGAVGARDKALMFNFTVTGPGGYSEKIALKAGEEKTLSNLYFGTYTVEEDETDVFDTSYSPDGGRVTLTSDMKTGEVTVTNTNTGSANVSKTVSKVWENGPKPETTIELWRKGYSSNDASITETDIDEKVGSFVVPEKAEGNDLKHTFNNLAKYDPSGCEFEYYAKEDNVPENYEVSYSEDGLTVINTYVVPTDGTVEAKKVWDKGPSEHPTVWFKLYRQVGETVEEVPDAEIKELPDGTTEVSWEALEETNLDGERFTFFVKEVDESGNPWKHDHYKSEENGLVIKNTYFENPGMKFDKSAKEKSFTKVGDVVTFVFTVENTGDVEITNITLTDEFLGIKDEVIAKSLMPGYRIIVERTYTVTEKDVANGKIDNTATVSGDTPGGVPSLEDTHTITGTKVEVSEKVPTGDIGIGIYLLMAATATFGWAVIKRKKKSA